MKKAELLAPAGNYECFLAAIHAGADAVYIGGEKYGARAYAGNFTKEEVCLAIRYAHFRNKKLYLTVNTLLKEPELAALYDYMLPFYEEGLDGVIVQDMGVISCLKRHFPELPLHASTQMTVTGAQGAGLLKELGLERVVPARELSLAEIAHLKKESGLEVEVFIHGAMCYCYSGQCLFSSLLGGRSGNRGRCAQPCRLPYRVMGSGREGKECYPLSLKDMCTLPLLSRLLETGVDSLKIEGRMKKAEYVAGVTSLYRKYMDDYYGHPDKPFRVLPEDMERLESLYIRSEISEGYYERYNGREMVTLTEPGYRGADASYLKWLRQEYVEKKRPLFLTGKAVLMPGREARLTLACQGRTVTACGPKVQAAQKRPLTEADVKKQLNRLGNTSFSFLADGLTVELAENCFLPVQAMNELRRAALAKLEEALLAHTCRRLPPIPVETEADGQETGLWKEKIGRQKKKPYLALEVTTEAQLEAVCAMAHEADIDRLYVPAECLLSWKGRERDARKKAAGAAERLFLVLPRILRLQGESWQEEVWRQLLAEKEGEAAAEGAAAFRASKKLISGVLIRNLDSLGWLRKKGYKGEILADAGLYAWNREAKALLQSLGVSLTAPYELNGAALCELGLADMEVVVYGRLPMMVSANCVKRTMEGCGRAAGGGLQWQALKDRYGKTFPVACSCTHCYNVIYNSLPLSLHDGIPRLLAASAAGLRLSFTTESADEIRMALHLYEKLRNCPAASGPEGLTEYTTGHWKRGAQ